MAVELSGVRGYVLFFFFFGNVRWRIDATDSCKLQNEQKNKNANGCPLRWPFGKIQRALYLGISLSLSV